ncbi:MAG TPA: YlbF family regulator [Atopostipes sp.]|jgi:Uncharacterized conserved protein|nr:YlbF family regulator [Atopostipes sp.]
MANVYDTANQLERELRETEQYQALAQAYEEIRADEDASGVLSEFQALQQALYQKQQAGEEISEEEALQAQNVSGKMTENELTMELMEKERALNQVLNDINGIIMKPVQDIYQG